MSKTRKNSTSSPLPILAEPKASLERAFFEAYLKSKGYTLETLNCLTRSHARRLRIQASIYASGKLAEIEARSHLLDDLHGEFT
jgi:hypothetical protein